MVILVGRGDTLLDMIDNDVYVKRYTGLENILKTHFKTEKI